jgi:hypothetical protein
VAPSVGSKATAGPGAPGGTSGRDQCKRDIDRGLHIPFVASPCSDLYRHDVTSSDLSSRKPISTFARRAALLWHPPDLDRAGQIW